MHPVPTPQPSVTPSTSPLPVSDCDVLVNGGGCRAQRVDFDDHGAVVQGVLDDGQQRQWRAAYVIDASGRDTLLAHQFNLKRKNDKHNSAALFGHFRGAQRLAGDKMQGHISIFWFEHGWFWFIPLADGTTSVGATCWPYYPKSRRKPLQAFCADSIVLCTPLAQRLESATLVDDAVHATGNYSYSAGRATGRRGPRTFAWFIYRMTNPVMRELFMHPRNLLRAKEAVTGALAGDVYGHSPLCWSLRVFKLIYNNAAFANWRLSSQARRQRRFNIQEGDGFRNHTLSADGH